VKPLDIVILGLTVTSSWGNGHATTYRSLISGLAAHGHRVLFLEQDAPWYAGNRDAPNPPGATTELYRDFEDLVARFEQAVEEASLVIVGSYVPDGVRCGEWVTAIARGKTAFYDIDTPITLAKLQAGDEEYITPALIRKYGAYFSFTGGPVLRVIEERYGSPMARSLYCSVDPKRYYPLTLATKWDLGYLGTYSADRQPTLERLLLESAKRWPQGRFAVAGPQYPEDIVWPGNVKRTIHLSPHEHTAFYGAQRYTLNVTREAMKQTGYAPSVRLFEAGACGVPIISDWWEGLDSVFRIGKEVLVGESPEDVLKLLHDLPDMERLTIAAAARLRVLAEHTPERRVFQLESYLKEMDDDFFVSAARGHGRDRSISGGIDTRMSPEHGRRRTGAKPGAAAVSSSDSGYLHKSPGALC
jgi:spore maturation protein CgeB